ncbi:MAG: hypothetical protein ACKVT2_02625 [Saprospiraceae bacterium]
MKHFSRLNAPDFLSKNGERWNQQWSNLKQRTPGAKFTWYQHKGQPVNQKLIPTLSIQTQGHCSYCDAYPMGPSDETIDHFKPKGNPLFFHLAYSWGNLYWACADCQKSKREQHNEFLLRPDDSDFSFQRFFIYNFNSHQIEVNPSSEPKDQRRGSATIQIFDLNHASHVKRRIYSWKLW